jgi:hypothetical protein
VLEFIQCRSCILLAFDSKVGAREKKIENASYIFVIVTNNITGLMPIRNL